MKSEQPNNAGFDEYMEMSAWALDGVTKAKKVGYDLDNLLSCVRIAWSVKELSGLIWKQDEPRDKAEMIYKMKNCCCFTGKEQENNK